MTLHPAPANYGIRFKRLDIPGSEPIVASAQNVHDTYLSSSLGEDGVQISTVEHLMSALWGTGIDNVLVTLNNVEVPILDGSARQFVQAIRAVGTRSCDAPKRYIRIKEQIRIPHDECSVELLPYDGFKISYLFDHKDSLYDPYPKYVELDLSEQPYVDSIADARTFGLMKELHAAQSMHKCQGSSLANAVGIDETGLMNEEGLRFNDEFVRHKALDAIGDLYQLGVQVIGEFRGVKSGHTLNNLLALSVWRCPEKWEYVVTEDAIGNAHAS